METKAKVITLCGKPKMSIELIRIANMLTSIGFLIIMPQYSNSFSMDKKNNEEENEKLQRQRIDMCEEVIFVMIVDEEDAEINSLIQFATDMKKVVTFYYVPPSRLLPKKRSKRNRIMPR